ncbi:MAG: hypothetical protein R2793_00430 [Flavobacteriaceae bacterium]
MGKTAILPLEKRRYDITERKKAELDFLTMQVLDAQHEVEQYQAIVTSLTEKSSKFHNFLAIAEAKRDQAKNNLDLMNEVVNAAKDLESNSDIALDEITDAEKQSHSVAAQMKSVVEKLIYAAEVINKFSTTLLRKKEQNPLISDEVMSIMANAGKDANNAVALSIVALKSSFASHAINMESQATAALEYMEAVKLRSVLTGDFDEPVAEASPITSIKALIKEAYKRAKQDFSKAQKADRITTKQLDSATSQLGKAQVKLNSLQQGLAAANAAAFAS